jgi:hypothetical protein
MKYMMHCITLDFMMNYNKKGLTTAVSPFFFPV